MIKIVTDSTGYLPPEIIEEFDIRVVPLNVHFGKDQVFKEGVELSNDEFYRMLREAPELPTTSQPSPGQFRDVFAELHAAGHEVFCTVISSRMSGTYQSALEAKRALPDARIEVVDTMLVAGGLGLMTVKAAEMAAEGQSLEAIVSQAEQMKKEIRTFFLVDTLEYLQKGGRIGTASALVGTLLRIKPVLTVKDGIVQPLDKARSMRKALQRLLSELESSVTPDQPAQMVIMYAQPSEDVQFLKDEIQQRLNCQRLFLAEVGAIVGTHAGPGVMGAVIYPVAWPLDMSYVQDQKAYVPLSA